LATLPISPIYPPADVQYQTAEEGGDQFENDGRVCLHITNTSGNTIPVTFPLARQPAPAYPGAALADYIVLCPAGVDVEVPKLDPFYFNLAGKTRVTYPAGQAANLELLVVRNPDAR
jgi:hypothetical protein